jgi:hypothetical protein
MLKTKPTNERRITMNYFTKHAQRSIATARDAFRRSGCPEDVPDEAICDLLTDLRHLCEQRGIDFGREDKHAAFRFERERRLP